MTPGRIVSDPARSFGLVCLLFTLFLGGCAKKEPGPEQAYKAFFQSMHLYAQDQNHALQEVAYNLLSSTAQNELIAKAETINKELPAESHIEPHMLLVSTGLSMGAPISKITVTEESDTEVLLDVTFPSGSTSVTMVLENGQWRVSLQDLPPGPVQGQEGGIP